MLPGAGSIGRVSSRDLLSGEAVELAGRHHGANSRPRFLVVHREVDVQEND